MAKMAMVFALAFCLCTPLLAQYTAGSLGGTVTDPTGASIPEAKVTARNTDTGFTQTTTTGPSGAFLIPRLPVGTYELRVEKPGFAVWG